MEALIFYQGHRKWQNRDLTTNAVLFPLREVVNSIEKVWVLVSGRPGHES